MLIPLLRWLTFAVSLIWVLLYFKGGIAIINDNKQTAAGSEKIAKYHYIVPIFLISFAGLTMFLTQALICFGIMNVPLQSEHQLTVIPGAILVFIGIMAEFWIRYRYLGRFWSGGVEIQENHQVIVDGPYRIVRHPLYAGNLLIYPGAALAFAVWWNWIACIVVIAGYIYLAAFEDKFLENNLPGYREYQRLTKHKFLPGIW